MVLLFPLCSGGSGPGIGCHIPPTLCLFICFVFRVHQHRPHSCDRFLVDWYVLGLENPCQLFRQPTNVGQTYGMLSSGGFSGIDVLLISSKLHGVENPRFIHFQDLVDVRHLFDIILLL